MDHNRSIVLLVLGTIIFLPSVAHAHGFPWWFGAVFLSPFLLLAALVAIPCKSAIFRFTVLTYEQSLSFKMPKILMLFDVGILFFSIWIYETANNSVRDYIVFNLIDPWVGWEHRAMYQTTYDRIVALCMGFVMTISCAAISWLPHYLILRKRVSEVIKSPPLVGRGLLLFWGFVSACVGPGLFWFPACFRLM